MITLTAPDGSPTNIDGKLVVRARRTVAEETGEENKDARTRVDWAIMSLVQEHLDQVAALVRAELASFTVLTGRDGSKKFGSTQSKRSAHCRLRRVKKSRAPSRQSKSWDIGNT